MAKKDCVYLDTIFFCKIYIKFKITKKRTGSLTPFPFNAHRGIARHTTYSFAKVVILYQISYIKRGLI